MGNTEFALKWQKCLSSIKRACDTDKKKPEAREAETLITYFVVSAHITIVSAHITIVSAHITIVSAHITII